MPLYFFHIRDAEGVIPDEEGSDLPDEKAARAEALSSIRDLMADAVKRGHLNFDRQLDVTDDKGTLLFVVPFGQVAKPVPKRGPISN